MNKILGKVTQFQFQPYEIQGGPKVLVCIPALILQFTTFKLIESF